MLALIARWEFLFNDMLELPTSEKADEMFRIEAEVATMPITGFADAAALLAIVCRTGDIPAGTPTEAALANLRDYLQCLAPKAVAA